MTKDWLDQADGRACRFDGARVSNLGRNSGDRCDLVSVCRTTDRSRARTGAKNHTMQRRVCLGEICDQEKLADFSDHGSALAIWNSRVHSKDDEIEPIDLDRGGGHISQIVAETMYIVCLQGT